MQFKTIDLCAGVGGIRRGFELSVRTENVSKPFSNFKNLLTAEIDKDACETYRHLYKEDPYDPEKDLMSQAFLNEVKLIDYDVLLAGFPCQSFSAAGKQLGFEDKTRGTIFFQLKTIIKDTKPKAIFLENVENLVRHNDGKTFDTIICDIDMELNYKVIGVTGHDEKGFPNYDWHDFVRNSKDFGIPQNRSRTYIMAFSREFYGSLVDNDSLLENKLPLAGSETLYEDLNDLLDDDVDIKYYMASGYLNTLKRHRQRQHEKGNGFGYIVVNRDGIEHPIANTLLATGGSGKERNLIYQPKKAFEGKMVSGKRTPINDEGIRVMTPMEWAKLQGFSGYGFEDFSFPADLCDTQRYKQMGNSVTIPVIKTMADFMDKQLRSLHKAKIRQEHESNKSKAQR